MLLPVSCQITERFNIETNVIDISFLFMLTFYVNLKTFWCNKIIIGKIFDVKIIINKKIPRTTEQILRKVKIDPNSLFPSDISRVNKRFPTYFALFLVNEFWRFVSCLTVLFYPRSLNGVHTSHHLLPISWHNVKSNRNAEKQVFILPMEENDYRLLSMPE